MNKAIGTAAITVALSIFSNFGLAQEIHHASCLSGCPAGGPTTNDLIIREIYILSSNDTTKLADWVAYRITKETIGPTQPRAWKADPLLAANETLEPEDYKGAHEILGTDRGHQAPLASFTGTPYWRDTNYLSNITPQKSALNQGAWQRLEAAARTLAQHNGVDAVYGITGPLYERLMPQLPQADEPHLVPSGYWKVLAIQEGPTVRVAAFYFDQHTPRGENFCSRQITVNEVERRSGLNFFHALGQHEQDQLEDSLGTLAPLLGCES